MVGSACHPRRKGKERLLEVHRVILDWKVPGDDRIWTPLAEKNRIPMGEAGLELRSRAFKYRVS